MDDNLTLRLTIRNHSLSDPHGRHPHCKNMGASGAESLNVAASIVMGQTESTIRTASSLLTMVDAGASRVDASASVAIVKELGAK